MVMMVGLTAMALMTVTAALEWRSLRDEWRRWRAARECMKPGFSPWKPPPPGWQAIFNAGEAGYPVLAELISDPDPQVGENAVRICDKVYGNQEPFLEYLRGASPLAAVKYLLPIGEGQLSWRTTSGEEFDDVDWLRYFCGKNRESLAPSGEAIEFLDSNVRVGDATGTDRALFGLASMLKPGEAAHPGGPLAARIVEILARAGQQLCDVEAMRALALRSDPTGKPPSRCRIPSLGDWNTYSRGLPLDRFQSDDFRSQDALTFLCHFNAAETLQIITRLLRRPELRADLEKVLSERPRLGPLEMPKWLPTLEAAKRFLARGNQQGWTVACVLAQENLQEGIPLINEGMAASNSDLETMIYRSCLLALGQQEDRASIRQFISYDPVDITSNLLWSGEFTTLEEVVMDRIKWKVIDLGDFVDGLPTDQTLVQWWAAHKDRIAFDPARRKFFVKE